MWWIISNSKSKYSNNLLGHAAVAGDNKPAFLRHFAQWIEEWQCMQLSNCGKFTLTKQTMSALIQTLTLFRVGGGGEGGGGYVSAKLRPPPLLVF